MKLFTLANNYPVITPEALMIDSFANIWNRDKTKDKSVATKELAYVYFLCDYKSIYNTYPDEIKEEKIIEDIFKNKYKPDKNVLLAIDKYNELQDSFNMRFLKSAKSAAEKNMQYFNNVDYSERDVKGNPVYKIKEVQAALKDCSGVIDTLDKLIEKVSKEQALMDSRIKGGGEVSFFEDK